MALCIMWTGCIDYHYDDKKMSQTLFPQSVRTANGGKVSIWGITFLKILFACYCCGFLSPTRANAAWVLSALPSLQFPPLYSQALTCLCVCVTKKEKENDLTTVLIRLPNGFRISALPLLCPAVRTPPSPVGPLSWVHDLNDADWTEAESQTLATASTACYAAQDDNSQQVVHWHA